MMIEADKTEAQTKMFYEDSRQHLKDELNRIDILINWQIKQYRNNRNNSLPDLRGLVILDEEVEEILKRDSNEKEENSVDKNGFDKLFGYFNEQQINITKKVHSSIEKGIYLPLYQLINLFQLTQFEKDCLLICLASELDLKYQKLYSYLQDDVTKKKPTIDLLLKLLSPSFDEKINSRIYFSSFSPLIKWRLITFIDDLQEKQNPLISRQLKLDDRIVDFLLNNPVSSNQLTSFVSYLNPLKSSRGINYFR